MADTADSLRDAAPDLLAALEEILDYSGGADHALDDPYVVERALTAVAKAKGTASTQPSPEVDDTDGKHGRYVIMRQGKYFQHEATISGLLTWTDEVDLAWRYPTERLALHDLAVIRKRITSKTALSAEDLKIVEMPETEQGNG